MNGLIEFFSELSRGFIVLIKSLFDMLCYMYAVMEVGSYLCGIFELFKSEKEGKEFKFSVMYCVLKDNIKSKKARIVFYIISVIMIVHGCNILVIPTLNWIFNFIPYYLKF